MRLLNSDYHRLVASPGVPRLLGAAVLSRSATSMLGLSVILAVTSAGRSFGAAGTVILAHATALAFLAPVAGRLADRWGARTVLARFLVLHCAAYVVAVAALAAHLGTPFLCTAFAVLGATTPPASAIVRRMWPSVAPSDCLRAAYALDGALNSATFVVGPLIVSAFVVWLHPGRRRSRQGRRGPVGDAATIGMRTEAFAWLTTFMWLGYGLGTMVAGNVEPRWGPSSAYWTGALSSASAAALACLLVRRPGAKCGPPRREI